MMSQKISDGFIGPQHFRNTQWVFASAIHFSNHCCAKQARCVEDCWGIGSRQELTHVDPTTPVPSWTEEAARISLWPHYILRRSLWRESKRVKELKPNEKKKTRQQQISTNPMFHPCLVFFFGVLFCQKMGVKTHPFGQASELPPAW